MSAAARIGLLSVSDRASSGEYEDKGLPGLRDWLGRALKSGWTGIERLVPDERDRIEAALTELADDEGCCLILTTGGTGPARRDVTPDATLAVADRVLEGFGERMRAHSLKYAPTAILSRQVAAVRGSCLIVNLPGRPKAIAETLEDVFSAVPYCIDLLEGPRIETDPDVVVAFRPKGG